MILCRPLCPDCYSDSVRGIGHSHEGVFCWRIGCIKGFLLYSFYFTCLQLVLLARQSSWLWQVLPLSTLMDQWLPLLNVCIWLYLSRSSHNNIHIADEASIVKRFLHGTGHYTPNFSSTNKELEAAMHTIMHERNIQCHQLERTLHLSASLVEVRSSLCKYVSLVLEYSCFDIVSFPWTHIRREEDSCSV